MSQNAEAQPPDGKINNRKDRILALQKSIQEGVVAAGLAEKENKVKVNIGVELEFYQIAGEKAAYQRARELEDRTENDSKHADGYMPPNAQEDAIRNEFFSATTRRGGTKTPLNTIICEPPLYENIASDRGVLNILEPIAIAQKEVISNPLVPLGAATWMEQMGQHIIEKAPKAGLKRAEIVTGRKEALTNSVHLHISVQYTDKKGEEQSIFIDPALSPVAISEVKEKYGDDSGLDPTDPSFHEDKALEKPWELSPLGFSIGKAFNETLADCSLLFTRSQEAYDRRLDADKPVAQPSSIGFFGRKKIGHLSAAIFRGGEKHAYRTEEKAPRKKDAGPVRIELRLPDVAVCGHPNKEAYPDESLAPYEAIQTLLFMVDKGIKDHLTMMKENTVPPDPIDHSEALLLRDRKELPMHTEATDRPKKSDTAKEIFGNQEVVEDIITRAQRYDQIREQENRIYPYSQTQNHNSSVGR